MTWEMTWDVYLYIIRNEYLQLSKKKKKNGSSLTQMKLKNDKEKASAFEILFDFYCSNKKIKTVRLQVRSPWKNSLPVTYRKQTFFWV